MSTYPVTHARTETHRVLTNCGYRLSGYHPFAVIVPAAATAMVAGVLGAPLALTILVYAPLLVLEGRWSRFTTTMDQLGHHDSFRLVGALWHRDPDVAAQLDIPTMRAIQGLLGFERICWSATVVATVISASWAHATTQTAVAPVVLGVALVLTGAGYGAFWARTTAAIGWIARHDWVCASAAIGAITGRLDDPARPAAVVDPS